MPRESILLAAEKLVNGDRAAAYGNPADTYERALAMFEAWKGSRTVVDAGECMMLFVFFKLARDRACRKRDNRVDAAGYLELHDRLYPAECTP